MIEKELKKLIVKTQTSQAETQTIEVKAAHQGCPERLYDTLSSFSNQDDGGILLFGLDERAQFAAVGVYDLQDLQKRVVEQCNQMQPVVRPVFTALTDDGLSFLSAEIPAVDISERPCYYGGKGRVKGSYVRVGEADEPMTEYEVYSYEAYRRKYQDDVRPVERATMETLDRDALTDYLRRVKKNKPNLAQLPEAQVMELMGMTREGKLTLAAVQLFGLYPQAHFPQMDIIAVSVPGTELGAVSADGERFIDNRRIDGNIPAMLDEALIFVGNNTKRSTIIDPDTGKRVDRSEYPMVAVREAVLNTLVHRDYSIHTEGKPIQILLFSDRLEIQSPGGLYGRLRVDQLGKVQPDTRNPVLATALELLNQTENRYSGIPTMRQELARAGLPQPIFADRRGSFVVTFLNRSTVTAPAEDEKTSLLLEFCKTPRTRQELARFLGLDSVSYAVARHIMPLVEQEKLRMTNPAKPRSRNQGFVAN